MSIAKERKTSTPLNPFISIPLAVRERRLPKSIPAASLEMRTIGDALIRRSTVGKNVCYVVILFLWAMGNFNHCAFAFCGKSVGAAYMEARQE